MACPPRSGCVLAAGHATLEQARHTPISSQGVPRRGLLRPLDGSTLVVSLDPGPLHTAAALRRPVIAFVGYSDPKRVGPHQWSQPLMVDAYGDPCEDYESCLAKRMDRMALITVETVLEKVATWRERYATR